MRPGRAALAQPDTMASAAPHQLQAVLGSPVMAPANFSARVGVAGTVMIIFFAAVSAYH
jgi:hypothetical protein